MKKLNEFKTHSIELENTIIGGISGPTYCESVESTARPRGGSDELTTIHDDDGNLVSITATYE